MEEEVRRLTIIPFVSGDWRAFVPLERAEQAEARVQELLDEASLAAEALDDMTIGNAKSIDRAEKAEARVKELEADAARDIQTNLAVTFTNQALAARLAVAVKALEILGTDTNPQTGSLARAALSKVREGQS
jgi:hypothetical protein